MFRRSLLILATTLAACAHRAPQAPPPAPAVLPPASTGPVTIDIPHRPGTPVVVLPLQSVGAPLFAPELERLRRWTARHLATQTQVTLDPVPLEEMASVIALADDHRLTPDARQCGTGPTVAQVAAKKWPEAVLARSWAVCGGNGCALLTEVVRPAGDHTERLGLWRAEVEPPYLMPQWEGAAQTFQPAPGAFVPQPPQPNPETIAAEPPVSIVSVRGAGTWSEPPTPELFQSVAPRLSRCHIKGRLARGEESLVLAYDASGVATRCEGTSPSSQSEDILQCFCSAALKAKAPPGDANRRAVLALEDPVDLVSFTEDGAPILARIEDFQSSSPAITEELLWPARPWLSLCYGSTRLREEVRFPVRFSIDETGHITSEKVEGIAAAHALGPCVEGYLRFMLFPCTPTGATVTFSVRIGRVDDQNRPTSAAPVPVGTMRASRPSFTGAASSTRGWNNSGMPTPKALPITAPVTTSVR